MFLRLCFVFVLAQLTFALGENEPCLTPRIENGTCISIKECSSLLSLLTISRPLPRDIVTFLRQSQCGFEGRNPLVCCPDSSVTAYVSTVRRPVDVSYHRNLRLLPLDECGAGSINRIVNGRKTGLFEFPWMALIGYNTRNGLSFRCGGTLINKRYVLTAAHCLRNLPNDLELAKVRLGDHDVSTSRDCDENFGVEVCMPDPQNFDIDESRVHPKYAREKLQNDIGLIRLSRNVRINDGVRPICLPIGSNQNINLERKKVIVSGWGATEFGTMSPELLKVDLRVMPFEQCARIYRGEVQITHRQICAGGTDNRDSCGGDSGGPLKYIDDNASGEQRYVQYGIVSFGPRRCATKGRPGVYTRVGYYMDWILNSLRP